MENSPLSSHLDFRLRQLNQDIHSCLKDIRQRIQEVEEVEQQTRSGTTTKTGQAFAELLDQALEERDSPEQNS